MMIGSIGGIVLENNKLPSIFDTFDDARRAGFLKVKEMKDNGEKIVGIFCTYAPREVIYAAGAQPVGLCAVSSETINEAEKYLPKNLCPLIKASYGFAITDKCPYIYFSDIIVGETTCDGKKKMYELLNEKKETYVMDLPHNPTKPGNQALWANEVKAFKEKLEDKFNVEITDEKLSEAIKNCNEERKLMQELYGLTKLDPSPISGMELHQILFGSGFLFDKTAQNTQLREMIGSLKEKYEQGKCELPKGAKRILITGCPSGGVASKIIQPLEEAGAVVVAFENCVGIKNFNNLVDEDKDPITAIADRYLKIPCSVMSPNDDREEMIKELIDDYQIDGVIDIILQACHTYNVETEKIKRAVNSKGTPYMVIETDYSDVDTGQLKTRLEAFVEMI